MGARAIRSRRTKGIDLGLERILWSFVCRVVSIAMRGESIKTIV